MVKYLIYPIIKCSLDQVPVVLKAAKEKIKNFLNKYTKQQKAKTSHKLHTPYRYKVSQTTKITKKQRIRLASHPANSELCRYSRLKDYLAYKNSQVYRSMIKFLDIKQPDSSSHPIFKEDKQTREAKITQGEKREEQISPQNWKKKFTKSKKTKKQQT